MIKPFHGIRAVLFDFDGTLADTCAQILEAKIIALKELGFPNPDHDTLSLFSGLSLREGFIIAANVTNEAIINELSSIYHDNFTHLALKCPNLMEGTHDTLMSLRKRKIKTAVMSLRRDTDLKRVIEAWNLTSLFDATAGEDLVANAKPAPDLIFYIATKLKVTPQEILVVGDTIYDIEMGHSAGSPTLAFTGGAQTERILASAVPDAIIDRISQIPALIA